MAYTPKVYSPDMTDKQARAFLKRQGMGQQEIDTAMAINPETGTRQIDAHQKDLKSEAATIAKKKSSTKARQALTQKPSASPSTPAPEPAPDRPLSREAIAGLADYGISGLRTYDEAFAHMQRTAETLGYPIPPTKRLTSTEVTDEAEAVSSRFAAKDNSPRISGEDASLIDQAHSLHVITKGMAVHSSRGSLIQPKVARFTPSGATSKKVKEVTRPDYTPPSGRPLINLGPIPKPVTEGMSRGQQAYHLGKYNKAMKERHELFARLSAERIARVNNVNPATERWNARDLDEGWDVRNRPDVVNLPPSGAGNVGRPATPEEIEINNTATQRQKAREEYLKANPTARRRGWTGLLTGIPDTSWE